EVGGRQLPRLELRAHPAVEEQHTLAESLEETAGHEGEGSVSRGEGPWSRWPRYRPRSVSDARGARNRPYFFLSDPSIPSNSFAAASTAAAGPTSFQKTSPFGPSTIAPMRAQFGFCAGESAPRIEWATYVPRASMRVTSSPPGLSFLTAWSSSGWNSPIQRWRFASTPPPWPRPK